jgi:hypothetical protein
VLPLQEIKGAVQQHVMPLLYLAALTEDSVQQWLRAAATNPTLQLALQPTHLRCDDMMEVCQPAMSTLLLH